MFARISEDSSSFKLPTKKKHYKLHNSVVSQSLYCTVLHNNIMAKTGMIRDLQDMPCCFLQNSEI